MANKNSEYNILEYLQKNGAVNSFKLAHVLDIKREELLRILKNLEEQGAVKIVTGNVEFLSYPSEKKVKRKQKAKVISKEKSEIQTLQEELEKQKLHIKELEQRPPKIITRTIIKESKPKVITRTIIRNVKPIKIKQKRRRNRKSLHLSQKRVRRKKKKIQEVKIKPKKIKKSIKLKLPKLKIPKLKLKNKIKNFIKYLKRR